MVTGEIRPVSYVIMQQLHSSAPHSIQEASGDAIQCSAGVFLSAGTCYVGWPSPMAIGVNYSFAVVLLLQSLFHKVPL